MRKPEPPVLSSVFGVCICLMGILMYRDIPKSDNNKDPLNWLLLYLIAGLAMIGIGAYSYYKKYKVYQLFINNPKEFQEKLNIELSKEKQRIAEKNSILQKELEEAICSQKYGSPWDRYYTDPCPYCGHYKVRPAKWDDKRISVAFWGVASSKLGTHYKCEYCKKMWS